MVQDDHVAGHQVGRHGPEGNGQLVEDLDEPGARYEAAEQVLDVTGLGRPQGVTIAPSRIPRSRMLV